jgi:hypothetical protein
VEIVCSLEKRIERASDPKRSWKPRVAISPVVESAENPTTHQEHCRLMLDIIALAFQSDATRITTFMFGNSVSGVRTPGATNAYQVNFRAPDGLQPGTANIQLSAAWIAGSPVKIAVQ